MQFMHRRVDKLMLGIQGDRAVEVALVGSYPPPHGGQSVHILNLFRYLRVRGMGVRVFNTGSNKSVRDEGVVNIKSSRSLLAALLRGPRIRLLHVHVSNAGDYGKLVPVGLAAMVKGFPWLVTIHSGNSADRLQAANLLQRRISWAMLTRARKIICVNTAIRVELSSLVGPEALAVVSPFSVDFYGTRLATDLEKFLANHNPIISCAGLYKPVYGFDQAVHTMTKVRQIYPNAGLILVGDTQGADWCRALITELRLEKNVKLCGNLEHQECLAVMSRSGLFLRPTLYDGDALSVREALSLGIRVVASATDFRPDGVILYRIGVIEDLVAKVVMALGRKNNSFSQSTDDHTNLEQVRHLYLETMRV